MPRSLGHVVYTDGCGVETVWETLTCAHCNRPYRKPQPGEPSGFCHMCCSPVCLDCGGLDRCEPFERKLERMESRAQLLRSIP